MKPSFCGAFALLAAALLVSMGPASLCAGQATCNANQFESQSPADDYVGHPFAAGSGANVWSSNFAATIRAGHLLETDRHGNANGAIRMTSNLADGIYLDHTALQRTTFTISMWLKFNQDFNTARATYFLSAATAARTNNLILGYDSVNGRIYLETEAVAGAVHWSANNVVQYSVWRQLVLVNGDNGVRVFYNGVQVIHCTACINLQHDYQPNGVILGQEQDSIGGTFELNQIPPVSYDDVQIFRDALQITQVPTVAAGADRQCTALTTCNVTLARYVRVYQTSTASNGDGVINLWEIEVYSSGVNVARSPNTSVSMSSLIGTGYEVEKCFDGVVSDASMCHTLAFNAGNINQFILVDLGSEMAIDGVVIYNRQQTGSCGSGTCSARTATCELQLDDASLNRVRTVNLNADDIQPHFFNGTGMEYEVQAPTATTDRQCAVVEECGPTKYQTALPTATENRVCTNLTECILGSTFETTAPTATSDRACGPVSPCVLGNTYETAAATLPADRQCTSTATCVLGSTYETTAPTLVSNRVCSATTACVLGSTFETTAATLTSNRVCSTVSACNASEYETAAATLIADRQCTPLTVCNSSEYETTAATSLTDRVCTPLTECGNGEVEVVAATATTDRQCGPACDCQNALTADYKNTLAPDAAKNATTSISLNTSTWEVEFKVENVLSLTNGHVIAAPVDAQQNVTTAVTSLVSNLRPDQLWNPPSCSLSEIDVPAASLGVTVDLQTSPTTCFRSYTIKYSLIDAAKRTPHCTLSNNAQNEIEVECALEISSIRAYDLTARDAFLAKETVFRTSITMPRNLPNEVGTLLHASLAKCSVYAAPDFVVDCRIPALWNFATTFSVTQSPSWINGSSCVQTNGTDATYIRCDLESISQIYTEATATIAATVLPSGQTMNFNVNYSLPREETATATGALTTFVKSIGTKDGKFFYGNDDLLTLEIEVVDTARLQITDISLFNSDSPIQSYDLRSTPQFETVESQNATFFVIAFYPARVLNDGNFYRHGPHGVNVSFLFTAARRQQAPEAGEQGTVTYTGIGLKQGDSTAATSNGETTSTSNGAQTIVIASAVGALVAVVAIAAVVAVVVARRRQSTASADKKEASDVPATTESEKEVSVDAITVDVDESDV